MQCVFCLGNGARWRWPRAYEWLFAPLALPIHCHHCLSNYFLPTLYLVLRVVIGALMGWDR